jgi:hypothetical protein
MNVVWDATLSNCDGHGGGVLSFEECVEESQLANIPGLEWREYPCGLNTGGRGRNHLPETRKSAFVQCVSVYRNLHSVVNCCPSKFRLRESAQLLVSTVRMNIPRREILLHADDHIRS